jgi:hypothetical protein
MQPAERLGCVIDLPLQALVAADRTGIAHLAAAFAVKGRLVGQDDDLVARPGPFHPGAVLDECHHDALALVPGIAGEFGRALRLGNVEPDVLGGLLARALPGRAGRGLLSGHRLVEAGAIDAEALGAKSVLGQIVGEAERVVELEGDLAGQGIARLHRAGRLVQQPQAVGESLAEAGLLQLQGLVDQGLGADQLGVSGAHLRHQRGDEAMHQRLARTQDMRVAHRPAHDPAKDIAPALIGRQDSVRNEEA